MSEKPQKRLVSWQLYLGIKGARGVGYSVSIMFVLGGLLLVLLSLMILWIGFAGGHLDLVFPLILISGILAACGIVAIWAGKVLFENVADIPPVQPITRHNTGQLPAAETLVRPSDLPSSHQQAELLRAASQGKETPPEELLRAAIRTGQDM